MVTIGHLQNVMYVVIGRKFNMGMYTELHFNSELKKNVSQNIINVLQFMIDNEDKPQSLPDHPLFSTSRWYSMLRTDSYYFDADTHSTLRFDSISESYFLCIRCNLKNYNREIQKFVDWIMPYLAKHNNDFLGFYRYEEDETPTLIYADRKCE